MKNRDFNCFQNFLKNSSCLILFESNLGACCQPLHYTAMQVGDFLILEIIFIFVFKGSPRQSAQDWAGFASSRGQAATWQNTGSLVSV